MSEPLADLAYYYPQPYWRGDESDGLKNLLLFFDGFDTEERAVGDFNGNHQTSSLIPSLTRTRR